MRFRRETVKKIDLVTAAEACKLVQDFFQSSTPVITTKTVYNKVWDKQLKRYGPRHRLMLDRGEVLAKLCRHHGK